MNDIASVSQSVKDVLQSLVDDGLVQADKIGASNCESITPHICAVNNNEIGFSVFWSFPSQRGAVVRLSALRTPCPRHSQIVTIRSASG